MSQLQMNLRGLTALLVDSDPFTSGIVTQILRGFGLTHQTKVATGAQAMSAMKHNFFDLCICEAVLPDMSCAELVRWVRRNNDQLRFIPIMVLTGYTQLRTVAEARDAGATLVVKKPASPKVIYEHIAWAGLKPRPFIDAGDYIGPERRFRNTGPADGVERRQPTVMSDATATGDARTPIHDGRQEVVIPT